MHVLNILSLMIFVSSVSARVGIVEPVDSAILNEYVVMLEDGVESRDLVNGLKNSTVNGLKSSCEAENLQDSDKACSYLRNGSNVDVYILDTGIVIDLEGFGVPSASFGSDEGEGDQGDCENTTTCVPTDALAVFEESIVIQGAPEAQFGKSIALSSDGSILAVGAPSFTNELGSEAGRVSLYELEGNSANLIYDISGAQDGLRAGQVLSMSRSSPPVLAIGGTNFVDVYPISQFLDGDGGAANPPVLEFDRFEADFTDEDFGASIAVSGDGTRLAVASPGAYIGAHDVGQVQIYEIGSGQVGVEIVGLDGNDFFGSAVALSEDGTIVAVGAITGSSGAGYVRVFSQNGANWDQVGQTIEGRQLGDNLGKSLSISADGQTVAIGAYQADAALGAGYVQVYQLVGTTWTQIGADIIGLNCGDRFGFSVALTPDASFLTIGANANDSDGFTNNGLIQTYENQNGKWTQTGGDITGDADGRNLGVGVAISSDGQTIAAGGPLGTAVQDTNVGEASVHFTI
jgi:hypothetical protein